MSRFKEFYLLMEEEVKQLNESLPPGFTADDVESLEDFVKECPLKEETDDNDKNEPSSTTTQCSLATDISEFIFITPGDDFDLDEDVDDAEISDVNINKLKKQVHSGEVEKGVPAAERERKLLHNSNIVDEKGNVLSNSDVKKKLMTRPKSLIGQNDKIGKSGDPNQIFYDLTLPAYRGLYVDESTGKFKVVKTCPSAGECTKFCYASRGNYLTFPASGLNSSRTVNFLMNDFDGFKNQLISELESAKKKAGEKQVVLRWHDSGDFISEKYLLAAYEIAKTEYNVDKKDSTHPMVLHYAYTKQIPMVKKLEASRPENFIFNYSFGGLHDKEINVKKDKYAKTVPLDVFKSIPYEKIRDDEGTIVEFVFKPKDLATLKQKIADTYNLDINTVITYNEMMKIPVGKTPKWNVLIFKGAGDTEAARRDVRGTFLFFH